MRLAAQGGGDDEPDHPGEQEWLAAEQVTKLARDRDHDGGGHQIGGDDPGVIAESVQLGHDSGHGGAHDRLVQSGEQQRQHGAGHDRDRPPPGQSLRQMTAGVRKGGRVPRDVFAHALLLSATGAPVMLPISWRQACRNCSSSSMERPAAILSCHSSPWARIPAILFPPAGVS